MKINWRIILEIHVYTGLFCLPYLLIFGLSSLDFNHKMLSTEPLLAGNTWERNVQLTAGDDLEAFSEVLADSLGIMGWYLPWDSRQDSSKTIITWSQPGKKYTATLYADGKTVIKEKVVSFSELMKIMHFLGESVPNAPWWIGLWKHYQSLTVYATLFWVISGIYLWMRKKKRPTVESVLLWGGGAVSLLFILYLWLRV